jgi:MoxR-like ATPase
MKAKTALNQVTHAQALNLLRTCGTTNTFGFVGQPGIGKSALMYALAEQMPDYVACYIDCANLDLGDLGMPVIDREQMVTRYAPNTRFGIGKGQDRPVLLFLDELGKASKPVRDMLLPVLLEKRLADVPLPPGSIVFFATNLATDGVGDQLEAHAWNRVTVCDLANPTSTEWLVWAAQNNIAPEVMMFARDYPQIFQRYDEMDSDVLNPFNFNPLTGQVRAVCTPRSLAHSSHIVRNREALGEAFLPALAGTIGDAAAQAMETFVRLADAAPRLHEIFAAPDKCRLPDGVGAHFLLAFSLSEAFSADTADKVMTYVSRWEQFEATTLFAETVLSSPKKLPVAAKTRAFTTLAAKLGKYF